MFRPTCGYPCQCCPDCPLYNRILFTPRFELGPPWCPRVPSDLVNLDGKFCRDHSETPDGHESRPLSKWVISTCFQPSSASPTSLNPRPELCLGFHCFASRVLSKPSRIRGDH